MKLTEEEARIVGLTGRPEEEVRHFQQLVDDWDYGKIVNFKDLLDCIQKLPEKNAFNDAAQSLLFLQLLRQMRLAWTVIAEHKKPGKVFRTDVHDTLTRYSKAGREDFWKLPGLENKLNLWKRLDIPLSPGAGNDTARNRVFELYEGYITKQKTQDAPFIPSQAEDNAMEKTALAAHSLPKNLILYGSPGTGKTYKTVQYAVAIVENRPLEEIEAEDYGDVAVRYRQYRQAGFICFTTFHQSYEYEEFIEGLRPVLTAGDPAGLGQKDTAEQGKDDAAVGGLAYTIHDGVFKAFCRDAETVPVTEHAQGLELAPNPTVWKISLERTGDNPTRRDCLDNGHIRIAWDGYGPNLSEQTEYKDGGRAALDAFYNRMQPGDIVLSCYSNRIVDAVGIVTGEPEWHDEYGSYKRLRKVHWLKKDIREDILHLNGNKKLTLSTVYQLGIPAEDILAMIGMQEVPAVPARREPQNFVFIIDEINRGNMAKIFGELITLIEESKRLGAKEEMRARLPYSNDFFGVPDNVFIIGTMNTADRSIALMDAALRRRFSFVEVPPEPGLLQDTAVAGISIRELLDLLNRRIEALLDRDHVLGHAAFLGLKENADMDALASIMKNAVLPLLQEYFYDDYEKIRLVLGDNQKRQPEDVKFIEVVEEGRGLFGDDADATRYRINSAAFTNPAAYKYLGLMNPAGEPAGTSWTSSDGAGAPKADAD